ncbi:MAG: hypothetical protein ACXW5U_05345 [Thermoanaerobaculia bacterium]
MATQETLNVSTLKQLYASDTRVRAVLDHFASRQQDRTEINVDRMLELLGGEGYVLSRSEVIEVFRALEKLGAGTFIVGRKKYPSRFQRTVNLIELGKAARGETQTVPVTRSESHASTIKSDVIAHRYVLRPDFTVSLQLPQDLTTSEATRLAEFLKTLPFS